MKFRTVAWKEADIYLISSLLLLSNKSKEKTVG